MQKLADMTGQAEPQTLTVEEQKRGEELIAQFLGGLNNVSVTEALQAIQRQPDFGVALGMMFLMYVSANPHYHSNTTTVNDVLNLLAGGQANVYRLAMLLEERRSQEGSRIVPGRFVTKGV